MASSLQRVIGRLVSDREKPESTQVIPAGPNTTTANGRPTWQDAFPPHLDTLVDEASAGLPPTAMENSGFIHVGNSGHSWEAPRVDGYPVQIPARMYNDVSPLVEGRETGGIQPLILACMYSRHHDGYVRQKAVARLLKSNDGFVAPYIVQMLGEYVTPIASDVLAAVTDPASFPQLHEMLRGFARENPTFVALTRKRAEGYWTAYDTSTWPNRRQYPALVALDEIAPPNDRDHEVS